MPFAERPGDLVKLSPENCETEERSGASSDHIVIISETDQRLLVWRAGYVCYLSLVVTGV